jgi:hypothetical protein
MENGIDLIAPSEATEAAIRGIRKYGLESDPGIAAAVSDGQPGVPLLIKRFGQQEGYYYLIPWLTKEGTALIAEVDANNGMMGSVSSLAKPIPHLFLEPDKAINIVSRKFPGRKFGKPLLVWRPCRETTSPLRPLYEIPFEGGVLYVDMDGAVFPSLTPLGLGG